MFLRRQRTKKLTSFIFERNDELNKISEIQFEVKISIQSIFESKSFFSQFTTNVEKIVFFFSKNVNMIDIIKDQKNFIEQIKRKLTIIKIEKKNVFI